MRIVLAQVNFIRGELAGSKYDWEIDDYNFPIVFQVIQPPGQRVILQVTGHAPRIFMSEYDLLKEVVEVYGTAVHEKLYKELKRLNTDPEPITTLFGTIMQLMARYEKITQDRIAELSDLHKLRASLEKKVKGDENDQQMGGIAT